MTSDMTSEEFRAKCEARAVARMYPPARADYYKKVAAARGIPAADQLRKSVEELIDYEEFLTQ